MQRLEIAPDAIADLDDIHEYSVAQFGHAAADDYLRGLNLVFDMLLEHPRSGLVLSWAESDLRVFTHKRHHIYYSFDETRLIVARIVHVSRRQKKALRR